MAVKRLRYATGEIPRKGDLVFCLDDVAVDMKSGDKVKIYDVTGTGRVKPVGARGFCSPAKFSLVQSKSLNSAAENENIGMERRRFWEKVFIAELSGDTDEEDAAFEADMALKQWDLRWVKKSK